MPEPEYRIRNTASLQASSHMSNRFRWEGGAGLGLLKSEGRRLKTEQRSEQSSKCN